MKLDKMYSFDAAIRGYHYYRKYWQPEVNQKLCLSHERDNAFDVFSIKACDGEVKIVGHLPWKCPESQSSKEGVIFNAGTKTFCEMLPGSKNVFNSVKNPFHPSTQHDK